MAIRAYSELYLDSAMQILGHAMDFAIVTLNIAPDEFAMSFAVSDASKQFAKGNPSYVAGRSGCELARTVIEETCISTIEEEDVMYVDRSPEYWGGWALAFYQWYTAYSFMEILSTVPMSHILKMYPVYHEMDIIKFAEEISRRINATRTKTRLREYRDRVGVSQSQLAVNADVPIRQIQLFEQGQRDINKTSAITLLKLSNALGCRMEDLMEM